MRYKVFLHDKSHVERQIGFNLLTLNHALELADEAQKRFSHLDVLSIEIYKLEASFPFQVPADALNTSDSSAIPAPLPAKRRSPVRRRETAAISIQIASLASCPAKGGTRGRNDKNNLITEQAFSAVSSLIFAGENGTAHKAH